MPKVENVAGVAGGSLSRPPRKAAGEELTTDRRPRPIAARGIQCSAGTSTHAARTPAPNPRRSEHYHHRATIARADERLKAVIDKKRFPKFLERLKMPGAQPDRFTCPNPLCDNKMSATSRRTIWNGHRYALKIS